MQFESVEEERNYLKSLLEKVWDLWNENSAIDEEMTEFSEAYHQ